MCKAVGYGFWSNMVVLVLVILDIVFAVLTHEYNVFGSVKIKKKLRNMNILEGSSCYDAHVLSKLVI